MEAYSSSVDVLPIVVGGVVGRIPPPGDGRFVGGCVGFVRLNGAERRSVGGCVGHVFQPGPQRFLGGCVGFVGVDTHSAQVDGRAHKRAHREVPTRWGEEALEAAPA